MNAPCSPFPYRLRISHEGHAGLRLERPGRHIRINPVQPLQSGEIAVLNWQWPEHLRATAQAVRDGLKPTVVASQPVLDWLAGQGDLEVGGSEIDGVSVQLIPYQPIPVLTPIEAIYKARAVATSPRRVLSRIREKRGLPHCAPQVVVLTFADGKKLVHLNLSLHGKTPDSWLAEHRAVLSGAEWLLVGVDHGEDAAVLDRIGSLQPGRVLFTDMIGETRRWLGLPTALLTPTVDRAVTLGFDAYPFVSQASFRFE